MQPCARILQLIFVHLVLQFGDQVPRIGFAFIAHLRKQVQVLPCSLVDLVLHQDVPPAPWVETEARP